MARWYTFETVKCHYTDLTVDLDKIEAFYRSSVQELQQSTIQVGGKTYDIMINFDDLKLLITAPRLTRLVVTGKGD